MKTVEISAEQIKLANDLLCERWVREEFLTHHVNSPGECNPVNAEIIVQSMLESRRDNTCIGFLAVGCQEFSEVADTPGHTISFPSNMRMNSDTRISRFSEELGSMLTALKSFQINTKLAITFSDVEGILTASDHLNDSMFGLERLEKIISENDRMFEQRMKELGIPIQVFSHSKVLMEALKVKNVHELLNQFFKVGEDNSDVELLLKRLYNSDPLNLPSVVTDILNSTKEGSIKKLIWLDIMSPLAGKHRFRLHSAIKRDQPEMPIIVPFENAGKWESAGEPEKPFQTKFLFVSNLLGLSTNKLLNEWLQEAIHVEDDLLSTFINSLGFKIMITNSDEKIEAVKLLEKLIFETDTFLKVKEVKIDKTMTLKQIIKLNSSWDGSHIFKLLIDGKIQVNGVKSTPNLILKDGDIISCGSFRIKIKF